MIARLRENIRVWYRHRKSRVRSWWRRKKHYWKTGEKVPPPLDFYALDTLLIELRRRCEARCELRAVAKAWQERKDREDGPSNHHQLRG